MAKATGIHPETVDLFQDLVGLCKATSKKKNRCCRTSEGTRGTEIDLVNGAIVKYGKRVRVSTLIKRLLTALIKDIS